MVAQKPSVSLIFSYESEVIDSTEKDVSLPIVACGCIDHEHERSFKLQLGLWISTWFLSADQITEDHLSLFGGEVRLEMNMSDTLLLTVISAV